jgi:serine/threonine protein kinase/predicted negative regulator of RcsB-dependent stress response
MDTGAPVTQIGKYPILGVLGVGGMGVVYRGMDKSVGREVAIKTLTAATDELRQRFLLEARSGILNHPNIVTVYDSGEQDGLPYIVMEFVRGDSLENLLKAGRQFSLIEKLDMIHQTCLGLGYAHKMGVVHRDIKPANIMLQPDGNIKIVDFGVARLDNLSGHTQTGMVIGTFHYISPERLLGKPADGRADIWSVGVMLYRLLAGRLPFPGDDISILQKVLHEPYDPLQTLLSGYPPALDHVLEHALAKKPADRYETAEDMAVDIEAINDELKREHVGEVLGSVKQLIEQQQWASVRPVLLDLQRLNPQNTEVKKLLREVQTKLSLLQKSAQLQQLLTSGEEAVLAQRYADALEFYNQAAQIEPENATLAEKIEHVRGLKEKADRVVSLLGQSRDARHRSDFTAAAEIIDRALQLDERNTDLRNERARIVQEAELTNRERQRRGFCEAAGEQLAAEQYTEAIKNLRAALEIDPSDAETQRLYQDAVERQEQKRRRTIIEQIVSEISNCIAAEDFERAISLIQRAQEHMPGDAALLHMKSEAEAGQRDKAAKKLVEKTLLDVSSLFVTKPQEALTVVQQALEQMPGEPRLISLEEKVLEQTRKVKTEELKTEYLKRAQASIDAKQFDQAMQILESAAVECGESSDLAALLSYAREYKRKTELGLVVVNAAREAKALIAAGQFDAAIARLQPVAAETGDPSLEQLLRQANAGLVEFTRRVDAAMNRAQILSATSIGQALEFLSSQSQDIQQNPRVSELRSRLEASRSSVEATKSQPVAEPVPAATAIFESAPAVQASSAATATMPAWTPLQPTAPPPSLPTAPPVMQAPAAAPMPAATVDKSVKTKSGFPWGLVVGLVVVLLIAAAGAGYWFFLRPAPVVPLGSLELNATPFAEVVSITSEKGSAIPLPAGDHWTPMRLDGIPVGKYTVSFKGADGTTQGLQCEAAQTAQVCNMVMKAVDRDSIDEIIGGSK